MEPKGSLPQSQVPATCPFSEPDQPSPCPHPLPPFPNFPLKYRRLFYSISINWGDYKNDGQLRQSLARFEPTASQNC